MVDELAVKSFESPDETVALDRSNGACVQLGERKFWKATAEPGWKWSRDMPSDLETCPRQHRMYVLSGRMTIEMEDGTRETLKKGDVALVPPGHDA